MIEAKEPIELLMEDFSDIVLFLETTNKKSHNFLGLAKKFALNGMTLVPVNWEQLFHFSNLNKGNKTPVIIFTDGIQSKQYFSQSKKNILRRMITSNNFKVFHFTSFPNFNFFTQSKIKNYIKFDLPLAHKIIVEKISLAIVSNELSYLEIR